MAAAFVEALKRPDVVRGQFDLLYASLLGEGNEEEEEENGGGGSGHDEEGGWVGSEGEAASPGALSASSFYVGLQS